MCLPTHVQRTTLTTRHKSAPFLSAADGPSLGRKLLRRRPREASPPPDPHSTFSKFRACEERPAKHRRALIRSPSCFQFPGTCSRSPSRVKFAVQLPDTNTNKMDNNHVIHREQQFGKKQGRGRGNKLSLASQPLLDLLSFSYHAGRSRGQGLSCSLPDSHSACIVARTQQALDKYLFNDGAELQMKPIHAESSVPLSGGAAGEGEWNEGKARVQFSDSY